MSLGVNARRLVLVAVLALIGAMLFAAPALAKTPARVATLEANLTGGQEVPGPGDRNGSGEATVVVFRSQVCYVLRAEDVRRPTAAHIHLGRRGVAGPVVVELNTPDLGSPRTGFFSFGCEKVSRKLSRNLRANPARYYVNVHNNPFPDGAIRGQLSR